MSMTGINTWKDGTYISTSGCGCCGDSILVNHRDAKVEVNNTLELIVDYCKAVDINPRTLLNKYLRGESW